MQQRVIFSIRKEYHLVNIWISDKPFNSGCQWWSMTSKRLATAALEHICLIMLPKILGLPLFPYFKRKHYIWPSNMGSLRVLTPRAMENWCIVFPSAAHILKNWNHTEKIRMHKDDRQIHEAFPIKKRKLVYNFWFLPKLHYNGLLVSVGD